MDFACYMVGLCVCVCFFGFAFEVCLGGWLVLLLVYYVLRFEVVGLVLCGGCLEWVLVFGLRYSLLFQCWLCFGVLWCLL